MFEDGAMIIRPDYESDFTATWGKRKHSDLFPAVYRNWRAPVDLAECRKMINDLSSQVARGNDLYESTRMALIRAGDKTLSRPTSKDQLKKIRTWRNRYTAVHKAYVHWEMVEMGAVKGVKTIGVTQLGTTAKLNALAQAVKTLINLYHGDLCDIKGNEEVIEELALLRNNLDVIFVDDTPAPG